LLSTVEGARSFCGVPPAEVTPGGARIDTLLSVEGRMREAQAQRRVQVPIGLRANALDHTRPVLCLMQCEAAMKVRRIARIRMTREAIREPTPQRREQIARLRSEQALGCRCDLEQ